MERWSTDRMYVREWVHWLWVVVGLGTLVLAALLLSPLLDLLERQPSFPSIEDGTAWPGPEMSVKARAQIESFRLRRLTYRLPPSCDIVVLFDRPGGVAACLEAIDRE